MIITITGSSGSGKSEVSSILQELNNDIVYLDLDKLGHKALEQDYIIKELVSKIGIPLHDGKINRKELADIVFNDTSKLKILTDLSWKFIFDEVDKTIFQNKEKIIIIDGALIPNTKYFKLSDIRILVKADFNTRMNRTLKRDFITKEQFIQRDNSALQFKDDNFDFVIENIDLEKTKKVVKEIYDKSIISR